MELSTGNWKIGESSGVSLTVRSSAWRYLNTEMNPDDDVLVLVHSDSGWIAVVLSRHFPGTPTTALKVRLDRYSVLIPQPEQLKKLNGCTLEFAENVLSVI